MITPPPRAAIDARHSRAEITAPSTLTSKMRRQSSIDRSSVELYFPRCNPALLTNTSTPPNASTAAATIARTDSSSATSVRVPIA